MLCKSPRLKGEYQGRDPKLEACHPPPCLPSLPTSAHKGFGVQWAMLKQVDKTESKENIVSIETLTNQGEGIARREGKVVFVPFVLPGERVRVRTIESKRDYDRALPIRITKTSADRIEAPCPYFGRCGGCHLQHLVYHKQLEHKRDSLAESLQRIGKIEIDLSPIVPSKPFAYRNKIRLFWTGRGDSPLGLRTAARRVEVLPVESCPLAGDRIQYGCRELSRRLSVALSHGKSLRFKALTVSETETGLAITLEGVPPDRAGIGDWRELLSGMEEMGHTSMLVERRKRRLKFKTLLGEPRWVVPLGKFAVPAGPGTFHQVNPAVAERLYRTVLGWIGTRWDRAVEAYCGTGTLAMALGGKFREVLAADENRDAIALAISAAKENRSAKVRFYAQSAERFLFQREILQKKADLLVLDPPRAGCSPRVMQSIAAKSPRRIIMISCHPAALARDLAKLCSIGYQLVQICGFDMFPQTHHLEVAAVLQTGPSQSARASKATPEQKGLP